MSTPSASEISRVMAALGKRGGKARANKQTAEERRGIARLGGLARAKKFKAQQNGTTPSPAALSKNGKPATTRRTNKS